MAGRISIAPLVLLIRHKMVIVTIYRGKQSPIHSVKLMEPSITGARVAPSIGKADGASPSRSHSLARSRSLS